MTEADLTGSSIAHYHLVRKLGSGAMGTVYLARDMEEDEDVALKVLPARFSESPDELADFLEEAQLSIALDHPNIVKGLEVGEYEGVYFFAMEYIRGWTLEQAIEEHGAFQEDVILQVALQMGLALESAHEAGLVHKDIKPANILMTMDNLAHVSDFGLASFIQMQEGADVNDSLVSGTPHFMSPEQAKGQRDIDIRSDIYSMGVTLFQMAAGRLPFEGSNYHEIMVKQITAPIPDLREFNPEISFELSEVIKKMMAKEREGRYQTPRELQNEFHNLMMGKELLALDRDPTRKFSRAVLHNKQISDNLTRSMKEQKKPLKLIITVMSIVIVVLTAVVVTLAVRSLAQDPEAPADMSYAADVMEVAPLPEPDVTVREPVAVPAPAPVPADPIPSVPRRPKIKAPPGAKLLHYNFSEDLKQVVMLGSSGVWQGRDCAFPDAIPENSHYKSGLQVALYCVLRHDEEYFLWLKYRSGSADRLKLQIWVGARRENYFYDHKVAETDYFQEMKIPINMFKSAHDRQKRLGAGKEDVFLDYITLYFVERTSNTYRGRLYVDDFAIVKH